MQNELKNFGDFRVNVVEVAHDMQLQVAHYIKQDLKLLNSFDTWHGMDCN